MLESLPLNENADGFIFDNEMLVQLTKYSPEASSIDLWSSWVYGLGVLLCSLKYRLQKMHLGQFRIFNPNGRLLGWLYYTEVTLQVGGLSTN